MFNKKTTYKTLKRVTQHNNETINCGHSANSRAQQIYSFPGRNVQIFLVYYFNKKLMYILYEL